MVIFNLSLDKRRNGVNSCCGVKLKNSSSDLFEAILIVIPCKSKCAYIWWLKMDQQVLLVIIFFFHKN